REQRTGQHGPHGLSGPASSLQSTASSQSTSSTQSMSSTQSTRSPSTFPEMAANAALVLITVACSLLDRQLAAQAAAFEREGGFTERLCRVRSNARRNTK